MENKQELKLDILNAIEQINNLKPSASVQVRNVYASLTRRFRSLEKDDFANSTHYEIYLKSLQVSNEVYQMELKALTQEDDYATADNFFQIKMSLIGFLGWLDKDY